MEAAATTSVPNSSGKRVQPKPKTPLAAIAKKPVARKTKTVVKKATDVVDLTAMIAEAAYLLAASRGFVPGHDVEDWLNAEQQILARFG